MSAGTETAAARHGTREFPEKCTLEKSLEKIVDVYHRYSTREGNFDSLNFNEFKTLLTEQAPTFLQACGRNRPDYLNQLFKETDLNKDKDLTFEEFTIVLAKITNDAHHIIHKEDRCTPDKD
ncbi:PREDICTED: protein S100-A12-like [Calidris pugnax]|uniref:protein S100-A12-like n=1 Tax=Calidris pugnax TaxID=198806 RepID=UPI00071D46CF|nr:PREDICTED: protein S100-A12-like [Calidris pugnax]